MHMPVARGAFSGVFVSSTGLGAEPRTLQLEKSLRLVSWCFKPSQPHRAKEPEVSELVL